MIYDVKLDGESIFDTRYRELTLLNPHVKTEVNTAGSFEFTMPSNHLFYDKMSFTKTIEVYEDGDLIFIGRPIEERVTFNKAKEIYCEGALAFLNDTIYPYKYGEFDTTTVEAYFKALLNNHNAHVPDNRKIYPGKVDCKPTWQIYRQPKYEKTWSLMQTGLLNAEGGYFFLRKENEKLYLDYLGTIPYSCNQPVDFGKNILDYTSNFRAQDICTRLIPLGKEVETGQTDENGNNIREPMTCASVNNGDIGVEDEELVKRYGTVTRTITFSNTDSAATLLMNAQVYLKSVQWDALEIQITAAEMHYLNPSFNKFIVGQNVHCMSTPHGINKTLNLLNMDVDITSGEKKIILGTLKKRTLTEIYKQQTTKLSETVASFGNYTDDTPLGGEVDPLDDVHIEDVNNIGKSGIVSIEEDPETGEIHKKEHYADEIFNEKTKKWEPKKDENGRYMNGGHIDAKTGEYVSGFKSGGFSVSGGGSYGGGFSSGAMQDVSDRISKIENGEVETGGWKHIVTNSLPDELDSHTIYFLWKE